MAANGVGSESSPIVISDDEDEAYVCQQLFEQDVDFTPPSHSPKPVDDQHQVSLRQATAKAYDTRLSIGYQPVGLCMELESEVIVFQVADT